MGEPTAEIQAYLNKAVSSGVSDIFIVAGCPVSGKKEGQISPMDEQRLLPPRTKALIEGLYSLAERPLDGYYEQLRDEYSFAIPGLARFRVNAYRQRGSLAAVVRIVSFEIPHWETINIPKEVIGLSACKGGMILLSGAAGSGKSTTLACLLDQINRNRSCHVMTLEDPIEYLHRDQKSIISQQEIGMDTPDYITALKSSLRQSPDVIVLGDMEGFQLIELALSAAETGHLLLAVMRARSAVSAIERMLDSFPASQREQGCLQISAALQAVVCQQLLPDLNGGLIPVFEALRINTALRESLRNDELAQFRQMAASASGAGMISMDASLVNLYRSKKISLETVLGSARNPEQMRRRCG